MMYKTKKNTTTKQTFLVTTALTAAVLLISSYGILSNIQLAYSQPTNAGGSGTTVIIPQGASNQGATEKYYQPENITVSSGSSVTWQNEDGVAHTATARDGSFDTGLFPAGQSASVTVEGQGAKDYNCTVHPWMTGSITVQA